MKRLFMLLLIVAGMSFYVSSVSAMDMVGSLFEPFRGSLGFSLPSSAPPEDEEEAVSLARPEDIVLALNENIVQERAFYEEMRFYMEQSDPILELDRDRHERMELILVMLANNIMASPKLSCQIPKNRLSLLLRHGRLYSL